VNSMYNSNRQTFNIEGRFVHGSSFAIHMDNVDFMTWRMNEDSGEYWVKFHYTKKEVRVKVNVEELHDLISVWAGQELNIKIGEKNGMDN